MDALKSRKLWITVLASLGVSAGGVEQLPLPALICLTAIIVAYLIAQGMADFGKSRTPATVLGEVLSTTEPRGEEQAEPVTSLPKPPRPPTLPLLLLALGLALASPTLAGCGAGTPAPRDAKQLVEWAAVEAFNGAVVALEVADAKNAAYLRSLAHPTEADVEASRLRLERLQRARDALALVRSYLSGARKDGDGRAELGDAAEAVALVLQELQSRGVAVPERAIQGAKLAAAFARVGAS